MYGEQICYISNGFFMQCFFDTPGLMLKKSGFPHKDMKARIESAWRSIDLYDVLIVIFDAHRHLTKLVFVLPRLQKCIFFIYCNNYMIHPMIYAKLLSIITCDI